MNKGIIVNETINKIDLESITKLNVEDGDILFMPQEAISIEQVYRIIRCVKGELNKKICVVLIPCSAIREMRVVKTSEVL